MKGKVLALIVGLVLGGTGVGIASTTANRHVWSGYGLQCYKQTTTRSIACVENGGRDGVGLSTYGTVVLHNGKITYSRQH